MGIETAVAEYFDRVAPDSVKHDVATANEDLLFGPLQYDDDGKLWSFASGTERITEWFEEFSTLYFVDWVPEVCAMPNEGDDAQEIEPAYLKTLMFGKELAPYV